MRAIPPLLEEALRRLPDGLQAHLWRTQALARELARHHGLDEDTASLAALAHDLCRAEPPHLLLQEARQQGLTVHPVEEAVPLLLHGPVAALRLQGMGITHPEVLDAVRWHTTAHPLLTPLGKVVFLADKLDEGKYAQAVPFLDEVASLARHNLDTAMRVYLRRQIVRLVEQGNLLHPATVDAWNALLQAQGIAPSAPVL
ncbi:MAG: bis(5'-nucleosyl)-tetraphosphatase (symmetrical) YqeK [Dehalococcoidia bacterium]|nr:bis(5'-nucleosyl)-tetraphosphatase (symmetrical) YqeK [Dehalococcoidia bacterium]MDW8119129.1 bis(5'-nucleosyl)-tetraphosphatase (symmetrical) YqeK [Chloroflexota bacterium]